MDFDGRFLNRSSSAALQTKFPEGFGRLKRVVSSPTLRYLQQLSGSFLMDRIRSTAHQLSGFKNLLQEAGELGEPL